MGLLFLPFHTIKVTHTLSHKHTHIHTHKHDINLWKSAFFDFELHATYTMQQMSLYIFLPVHNFVFLTLFLNSPLNFDPEKWYDSPWYQLLKNDIFSIWWNKTVHILLQTGRESSRKKYTQAKRRKHLLFWDGFT